MAVETRPTTRQGAETVFVDRFCDGIIGPSSEMLGPVRDGGHIVANTAPGCWGPMITPAIKGGHEVTLPVAVEGAEVGDAVAIHIRDISVTSIATASGNDRLIEGRFNGDPYCAKVCAKCGAEDEATVVEGIGPDSVRCANCGEPASPFAFTNGYTIAFDDERRVGVTVGREQAEAFAQRRPHGRRMPGELDPEPDPALRPARPRRRRRRACGRSWASSGRPPRSTCPTRTTPATSARSCSARPTRARSRPEQLEAPHRRPPRHRRRPRGRDPDRAGQGGRRRDLPRRHARDAGRRRDRRPHRDVSGTVTLQVHVLKGLAHRRPDPAPGGRGPAVPGPAADVAGRAGAGDRDRAAQRPAGDRGVAADLGRRAPAPT